MGADAQRERVSFMEMKASVGSILFLWLSVERELAQQIEALDDGPRRNGAHTVSQKIARWGDLQSPVSNKRPEHGVLLQQVRARLMQALEIRNRISHGLIGITADRYEYNGEACLTTELNGAKRTHTHAELEHAMRVLSHLVWAIRSLGDAAMQKDPRKAESTYTGIRLNHLP